MRFSKQIPQFNTITNANINGPTIKLDQDAGYAMQAIWTDGGSLDGTVKLQASIDGTNWTEVANSSQSVSGGSGSYLWNVNYAFYLYARTVFTYIAGSGTITFQSSTKGP